MCLIMTKLWRKIKGERGLAVQGRPVSVVRAGLQRGCPLSTEEGRSCAGGSAPAGGHGFLPDRHSAPRPSVPPRHAAAGVPVLQQGAGPGAAPSPALPQRPRACTGEGLRSQGVSEAPSLPCRLLLLFYFPSRNFSGLVGPSRDPLQKRRRYSSPPSSAPRSSRTQPCSPTSWK